MNLLQRLKKKKESKHIKTLVVNAVDVLCGTIILRLEYDYITYFQYISSNSNNNLSKEDNRDFMLFYDDIVEFKKDIDEPIIGLENARILSNTPSKLRNREQFKSSLFIK